MKATPYIQAIEDCIVLLGHLLYLISNDKAIERINNMLERLNDLKVEYYFQKDTGLTLGEKIEEKK